MHVTFINYDDFQGPSGIHIFHLANALVDENIKASVIVPKRKESVRIFGEPKFETYSFKQAKRRVTEKFLPDIIHAWTPRETTRKMVRSLTKKVAIPYIVHLEDNEEAIIDSYLSKSGSKLGFLYKKFYYHHHLGTLPLSSLRHYPHFINESSGATLIFETLNRFLPGHLPRIVIWPSCEDSVFEIPYEPDLKVRNELGIKSDEIVLTYPGNIHRANWKDVIALYESVALVISRGLKIRFLRIGNDFVKLMLCKFGKLKKNIIELNDIQPKIIPNYIAAADILIQPGQQGEYNDYRFPSKLPMFLASGRPVILPMTNLAKYLKDQESAFILKKGSVQEMADAISTLAKSPNLRAVIGEGGRKFAINNFSWKNNATMLSTFYKGIINKNSAKIHF